MDCPGCGAENPEGNGFCGKCGASLPSPEGDDEWSRQYGPEGFGGRVVGTRDGVFVETNYSLLGWSEQTRYPRWMVTWPLIVFLVLLYVMSFLIMFQAFIYPDNASDYLLWGFAALGASLLFTFIIHRVYYHTGSRGCLADAKYIRQLSDDLPESSPSDEDPDAQRRM